MLLLLALTCAASPAIAQTMPEDVAEVSLLPGWRTERGTHMAALRIDLAPGWKTYWRSPGDAGIPPVFRWTGTRNVSTAAVHWPVPKVFDQAGMRSIGYGGSVIIPIELGLRDARDAARLAGEIEIGVCHDICIPYSTTVAAALPAGGSADPRIAAALGDQPATARASGAGPLACRIDPISDGIALTAQLDIPRLGPDETVVAELPGTDLWISPAETRRDGTTLTTRVEIVPPDGGPVALDRGALRLTVIGGGRAVDIRGCG